VLTKKGTQEQKSLQLVLCWVDEWWPDDRNYYYWKKDKTWKKRWNYTTL